MQGGDGLMVDVSVGSNIEPTHRMRQVGSMFDCPIEQKLARDWRFEAPIEDRKWNIGLIVGPSGCGKSTIGRHMFGQPFQPKWKMSLVDSFEQVSIEDVCDAFSSVGLNTIPAWLRNRDTLSNGEGFRADIANALLTVRDAPVVVDEFTSVVDRDVAKTAYHCVQKYIRKVDRQFVAISCHDDIIEWLQPDWIIEPASQSFTWRSLRQRPIISVEIKRCERSEWEVFRHYHYMMSSLPNGPCFGAYVNDRQVGFLGIAHIPISRGKRVGQLIWRVSRVVTLPDWQGVGIGTAIVETIARAYAGAKDLAIRNTPAHPSYVRSHKKSKNWKLVRKPSTESIVGKLFGASGAMKASSERSCHVFEWQGSRMNRDEAVRLIGGMR